MHKAMAILLLLALLLAGCAAEPAPVESTLATTEPAPVRTLAPCPTDYVTDAQLALADPWAGSNETALAAVMRKAEKGEDVTIAVIGGSITQGTISSGTLDREVSERKGYADIFHDWWRTTFPDSQFTFVNAGIGGTDSYLGVHRVQADVLSHGPDLVLVEFSVNDGSSPFCKISYDNLLRTMLLRDNAPAVMLLFLSQTNGISAQDIHSLVGFNYQLPMVSGKNVMDDMMDRGDFSEQALSGDTVHPSALGHRVLGEILWKYLNGIYADLDSYGEPEAFRFSPATKDRYTGNPRILDSKTITPDSLGSFEARRIYPQFPNSWITRSGDGEITFTLTFRNLGILFYAQTDGKGGQFEVVIDGETAGVLNADFSGGWGNHARAQEVFTSQEAQEHTVVIRRCGDSGGDAFTLLGLMVSE